jgi:hypothetical protein
LESDTREVVTKLLSILQDFVPAERLGDLARKLRDLEAAGA